MCSAKGLKETIMKSTLRKGKLGAKCGERLLNCLGHYLEINATERI